MSVIDRAAVPLAEAALDPSGRYVVAWEWGGGHPLAPGDTEDRQRVVYDADDYAEDTGRYGDVDGLEPGHLYDRTMDLFYPVAEWTAMRARIAEAERKRVTLAKVHRDFGMPRERDAVEACAVTEDGRRHLFTVASRSRWCAACGGDPAGHDSRHPFRVQVVNQVANRVFFALAFPDHDEMPAWLEQAYRAWSPESARLGEMRFSGEIAVADYDALGAHFARDWWTWHDDQWAGWSARLERDRLQQQQEQRRRKRAAALDATSARRAGMRARAIDQAEENGQ